MTAWQDQPPLSRRQVRQNERSGSAEGQLDVDAARPREGWDVDARRAATPDAAHEHATEQTVDRIPVTRPAVAGGRRAQRAVGPAGTADAAPADVETGHDGEPLIYATQGRLPQPPSAGAQDFPRPSVSATSDSSTESDADRNAYRVRDYSPEQRPSFAARETDGWAPPATPSDLDYRTQGAPFPPPASPTPVVMPPIVSIASTEEQPSAAPRQVPEERTMTRRELRALEQRGLVRPPVPSAAGTIAPVAPAPEPQAAPAFDALLSPTSDAPAQADEIEAVAPPALVDPLVAPAASPSDGATPGLGESLSLLEAEPAPAAPVRLRDRFRRQAAPVEETPNPPVAEVPAAPVDDEVIVAEIVEPVVEVPQPVRPAAAAQNGVGPTVSSESNGRAEPSTETGGFTPPIGHWSTQATIDDDEQFQAQPLARNIGATSGAITTNALVIPSLPSEELLRPLGATGEILITGSIDLPRSMSTTGAHPARYDHSDVDALLDADDREDAHPESAPVRAIRAVSTHTSTRGVMDARKPKGNSRLPIIFGITGAVLVLGIVALVVAGMVFKIF